MIQQQAGQSVRTTSMRLTSVEVSRGPSEDPETQKTGTVLVATDFSEASFRGVEVAGRLARVTGAEVLLVHVTEDRLPPLISRKTYKRAIEEHREKAIERLEEVASEFLGDTPYRLLVGAGAPFEVIAELADSERVDLVVMGSQGDGISSLGGLDRLLLGSTTERTLRQAAAPVLVVKPGDPWPMFASDDEAA